LADLLGEESLVEESVTPVLSRIRDARFKRMVQPGDKLEISVTMTERMGKFFNLSGKIINQGKVCLTISFALALIKEEPQKDQ
jgi:3-hydroxymyristoyl/3-hydroxydecanoyl-(acyl carrier protein) dehydratase